MIDAGSNDGSRWRDLWDAMRAVLGPDADHVGLDMSREGHQQLDDHALERRTTTPTANRSVSPRLAKNVVVRASSVSCNESTLNGWVAPVSRAALVGNVPLRRSAPCSELKVENCWLRPTEV